MKSLSSSIGIFALLFVVQAHAAPDPEVLKATLERQPACSNFVRFDNENLYLGFGSYKRGLEEPRLPIPAKVRVAPLSGAEPFELETKDAAIDLATDGASAYVLTYSALEEWDLRTRERIGVHSTYAIGGPLASKQHAEAMARYKDKLIIAHGRLGLSIFNIRTKRLVNQFRLLGWQRPLESMATGVTVQGNLAYVVMDNFHVTRPGDGVKIFRGIIVINMDSESVVGELEGMDPGADSIVSDAKKVIVSFSGNPIWKYGLESLVGRGGRGSRIPEPEKRVWRFPVKGSPKGHASMDEKYYYTCYSKAPSSPGENGGVYRRVPMVLDRRVLMLD